MPSYNADVFVERLDEAIDRSKLTQQQIAEQVGVSQQTISKWRRGETVPRGRNLRQLEEVMGTRGALAAALFGVEVQDGSTEPTGSDVVQQMLREVAEYFAGLPAEEQKELIGQLFAGLREFGRAAADAILEAANDKVAADRAVSKGDTEWALAAKGDPAATERAVKKAPRRTRPRPDRTPE